MTLKDRLRSHTGQILLFDFDAIISRSITQDFVFKLWAKNMIRELGLTIEINELFAIRIAVEAFVKKQLDQTENETIYELLISEVYNRLVCTNLVFNIEQEEFRKLFIESDFRSEKVVQHKNQKILNELMRLEKNENTLYCIYFSPVPKDLIEKLLDFHQIKNIFKNALFTGNLKANSSNESIIKSKLKELHPGSKDIIVLGSKRTASYQLAKSAGLKYVNISESLSERAKKEEEKKLNLKSLAKEIRIKCNNKHAAANSNYIFFYLVYISRLYWFAKNKGIKNLFFLAREGYVLRQLFDIYQDFYCLDKSKKIASHYLRSSRQASILVGLKALNEEAFVYFRNKNPDISIYSFLKNFDFEEPLIFSISKQLGIEEAKAAIPDFFNSDIFNNLKKDGSFQERYNNIRVEQKKEFEIYLNSFGVNFYDEGLHLADVGWGGTIQNELHEYFNTKIKVYGYYLGLREIYTITKNTKRFGLNFSFYPYPTYSDHILTANYELNEQLLSAPHGSALKYDSSVETYTLERHDELETMCYNEFIVQTQEFMYSVFKDVLPKLELICYDERSLQKVLTNYALKIGIFASRKNISHAVKVSTGFFNNVGDFEVGKKIKTDISRTQKISYVKSFIFHPEKVYQLVLRFKPLLYMKNKHFGIYLFPSILIYLYYKFNYFLRYKLLKTSTF